MANVNNFFPFGTGAGANVMTSAAWSADSTRLAGFEAGLAQSIQVNTAIRQATSVSTMIAEFTADFGDANVNDDGNIAALEAAFESALLAYILANIVFPEGAELFTSDTGAANAMVASLTETPTLAQGFLCYIAAAHANTGATTLNLNSIGNKAVLYPDGRALAGGDFTASTILALEYDGVAFRIMGSLNVPLQTQNGTWVSALDVSGSGNALAVTMTPATTAYTKYQKFTIQKDASPNTGPVTLAVDGRAPQNVVWADGSPLIAGDWPANIIGIVVYDGAQFTLQSVMGPTVWARAASSTFGLLPTFNNSTLSGASITVSPGSGLGAAINWSVSNGNAANGFQGGTTLPANATIHVALCQGTSGQCTFADTQFPVRAPAGFTASQRRCFSFVTNGSAILTYTAIEQEGGFINCFYNTRIIDIAGSTPGTSARTFYTMSIPTGFNFLWFGNGLAQALSTAVTVLITSPFEPDTAITGSFPGEQIGNLFSGGSGSVGITVYNNTRPIANSSAQICARCAAGNAGAIELLTVGFGDPRV